MNPRKISLSLFTLFCTLTVHWCFGQDSGRSLYTAFDNNFGTENLGINNGRIHFDTYRSADGTHQYYNSSQYLKGSIVYDGQPYAGILMKYDLLEDHVIVKINDQSDTGVTLINEKIAAFYTSGKKFVPLNAKFLKADFKSGFYEEETINDDLALYTKYEKAKTEILKPKGLFYAFADNIIMVVRLGNNWKEVASKSNIIGLFPEHESKIDDFYKSNNSLAKTDKKLFFLRLLEMVGSLKKQQP